MNTEIVIVGFDGYDMDVLFEKQDMFYERDEKETLNHLNTMMSVDYQSTITKIKQEQGRALKETPDILHENLSEVFSEYTKVLGYIYKTLHECGVVTNTPWCIAKILDDKTILIKRIKSEILDVSQ